MPRKSRSLSPGQSDGDARPWLKEKVYLPKQGHTFDLVKKSVDALRVAHEPVSLSSVEAKSKKLDPAGKGVHRNTILTNEEARVYYEGRRTWKKPPLKRPVKTEEFLGPERIRVKVDRDVDLARRRYLKLSRAELVERLLRVEQAYAEGEEGWLLVNDELLEWRLRAEQAESQLREKEATQRDAPRGVEVSSPEPISSAATFEPKTDASPLPPTPQPNPPARLNEYDYFAEIEELFVRRRGRHLLLSPVDWTLMEAWKEQGLPLHVVLRAINLVFDRHEARRQQRSVKSLHYCREEVEAQYAEWLRGRAGAGVGTAGDEKAAEAPPAQEDDDLPFTRAAILDHLAERRAAFSRERDGRVIARGSELFETLSRVASSLKKLEEDFAHDARPDAATLEAALCELDVGVSHALRAHLSQEQLVERRKAAEAQLRSYRDGAAPGAYEQMLDNLILKGLREELGVPRLSLFYL